MTCRKLIFLSLALLFGYAIWGQISGQELTYKYLGPGNSPNTAKYEVAFYATCNKSSTRFPEANPGFVYFCFFNDLNVIPDGLIVTPNIFSDTAVELKYTPIDPCVDYRETRYFVTNRYRTIIDLPIAAKDYIVTTYNKLSRTGTQVVNVDYANSIGAGIMTTLIPGTAKMGSGNFNSSPAFVYPVEYTACNETSLFTDFSTTDADGDVLRYNFTPIIETYDVNTPFPLPPPYPLLHFFSDYDPEIQPLGPGITINQTTGMMSGVAPATFGYYMVAVRISEYRNNVLINEHTKETFIYVNRCHKAKALLKEQYTECGSYTYTFKNEFVSTLPTSYRWDFGVENSSADTSSLPNPTFTYPDTGTYLLKLVVFDGECKDSATGLVKVYPGFKVGFIPKIACASLPVEFTDTSSSVYGSIVSWQWDFGDNISVKDTSTLQNPSYQYPISSIYNVREIVSNSLGCSDTALIKITVQPKIYLDAGKDTTICGLDTIQLHVTNGIGSITWSPAYNINDIHSESPLVSPDTKTLYKVDVVAGPGCAAEDSVLVDVINHISLQVYSDREICENDTVHLAAETDYANAFNWTPAASILEGTTTGHIIARPPVSTTYMVEGSFGSCKATAEAIVNVFPYPEVTPYGDTAFCYGKSATIGVVGNADTYSWTPTTYLQDPSAATHVVTPDQSIRYTIEARNLTGCTRPVYKQVAINVIYVVKAFAGNDTVMVKGQQLVLNATGGVGYEWTPATGLSSPFISNPVAMPEATTLYKVKVTNDAGCIGYDSVKVNVFYTGYDLLVPNAFSPNNDGRNDIFQVVAPGLVELKTFIIYNRWGQQVFSTKNISKGWNGTINGQPAPAGVYVWYISGKFLDEKVIEKRGTLVLVK